MDAQQNPFRRVRLENDALKVLLRFADFVGFSFVLSDFDSWTPQGEYDAVVSALAIHHTDDDAKNRSIGKFSNRLKTAECSSTRSRFWARLPRK